MCICAASFLHSICSKFSFVPFVLFRSSASFFFFCNFFPLSRSSSFHLLAWIVLCRVFSTLFAFEHHFRSAEAVAGAIAAFCFTNEYLSASYIRLWFQKHPKIVCNAIQPILLAFFLRFSRALIALLSNCTELNTRKILIYILLLSLIFSHFPVSFFRFFSFVTNESCFLFKMWRAKKKSLSHSHNFSHGFFFVLFLSHCTNDTKCFATTIATV